MLLVDSQILLWNVTAIELVRMLVTSLAEVAIIVGGHIGSGLGSCRQPQVCMTFQMT